MNPDQTVKMLSKAVVCPMPVLSVQLVNVSVWYKLVSTTVAMKSRGAKEKLREKKWKETDT